MQVFITNLIREKKGIKKKKPDYAFACRAIDCKEVLKKMPAVNASEKAKEKAELGTRIASRLSLSFVSEKELGENRGFLTFFSLRTI